MADQETQEPTTPPTGPSSTVKGIDSSLTRLILWGLVLVLGLVFGGVLLFQLVLGPRMELKEVVITSDGPWPKDYLLSIMGIHDKTLYFSLKEREIELSLQTLPQVKTVNATLVFPDTLEVNIKVRTAVVQHVLAEGSVILIDEDGVAFDYVQERTAYDIPVLTGLSFRGFTPGTRLPPFLLPFFRDLAVLRDESNGLFQAFSEFRLEPQGDDDIEVLCFMMQPSAPIRIGPRISAEAAQYMIRVLGLLESDPDFSSVREVDFRARDVVFKKGEA